MTLTKRQTEALTAIQTLVQERGYPPTVRELGDALGLSSPASVHSLLDHLERAGAIHRAPDSPRTLVVVGEVLDDLRAQRKKVS